MTDVYLIFFRYTRGEHDALWHFLRKKNFNLITIASFYLFKWHDELTALIIIILQVTIIIRNLCIYQIKILSHFFRKRFVTYCAYTVHSGLSSITL